MRARTANAQFWGAHACSVLVFTFCEDELPSTGGAFTTPSYEQSSRRQNAFAGTLKACAPQTGSRIGHRAAGVWTGTSLNKSRSARSLPAAAGNPQSTTGGAK